MAFLRVGFEVGGGKGWLNLPSPTACLLKLVKIMLETWNLVHKYTHICRIGKYTF